MAMKNCIKNNLFQSIVCICLVVLLICGLCVSSLLSNNGRYKTREVRIQYDGYDLEGTLFIPKVALEKDGEPTMWTTGENTNKVPGVVVQGGGTANRYVLYPVVIELVKRGFAVFAIDAYNHGMSERYDRGWGVHSQVRDALKYMHSLSFVDPANIGYCGHSQGGMGCMEALQQFAGYYTEQDLLLNLLHDELGVEISEEQVAAQDADAVAALLSDYEKGLYESRKIEVLEDYNSTRVSFALVEGMATGSAPPLKSMEFPNMNPAVVEVGGVPVMRNIQANVGNFMSSSDETIGRNATGIMEIASTKELATSPYMRAFFGTGDDAVPSDILLSVNDSANEEPVLSTVLGQINENSWADKNVQEASQNHSLRMFTTFTGWHNTNHYSEKNINSVANFAVLATGYNNGYLSETGGAGAVAYDDTNTFKLYYAATVLGFIALITMTVSAAVLIFKSRSFETVVKEAIAPQVSKKDPMVWVFIAVVVILPVLLFTPLMNNNKIPKSPIFQIDQSNQVVFWSLCCAAILLVLMIIKWHCFDKKKTEYSFCRYYGISVNWKTVLFSVLGVFAAWALFMTTIYVYYRLFNSANFTLKLPILNMSYEFTPISTSRYIHYLLYALYMLPYWIVGGMLVNSARMKDMPDWLNTIIIAAMNMIPIALFVYISYAGVIASGGTQEILGLNWGHLINMQGLTIAVPIGVIVSRVLYKRTGNVLPGALLNAVFFALPLMCTSVYL